MQRLAVELQVCGLGRRIERHLEARAVGALVVIVGLRPRQGVCHLTGYGASAIEYVLWFWIKDAATGPTGTRSAVMIALWDTFAREGVKLPIPGATRVILEQPK